MALLNDLQAPVFDIAKIEDQDEAHIIRHHQCLKLFLLIVIGIELVVDVPSHCCTGRWKGSIYPVIGEMYSILCKPARQFNDDRMRIYINNLSPPTQCLMQVANVHVLHVTSSAINGWTI